MAKSKITADVIRQERIADGIYSMWIKAGEIASQARAGQFISVYTRDSSRLLPRPISICEIDREHQNLRIVYRVAGAGTEEFSAYQAGDSIDILGPLGNGFPEIAPEKSAFLIGGGIGIPPMLELAKELNCKKTAVLGYRDSQMFLKEEFEAYADVIVATEDGSAGTKGNVLDAVRENGLMAGEDGRMGTKPAADVILACGPTPMLRALKAYAAEQKLECWLSLEERMACGIGACLACVCGSKESDEHSYVRNKRICKDGPVFAAEEVEL